MMNGRSIWADYLTDDPTAWRVRVGEHHMFSDVDQDQVDVDVDNIIFHPHRNRKRSLPPYRVSHLFACLSMWQTAVFYTIRYGVCTQKLIGPASLV